MNEQELRDLKERTALVKEMSEHPGWGMLIDRARVTLHQRQLYLIRGKADDYEEYVKTCAWMDGLSFLIELPERLEDELFEALKEIQEAAEVEEDDLASVRSA